jgi:hypothetical protein
MERRYMGRAYVRPVSRGIHLIDANFDAYLEDLVPDGYYEIEVTFRPLTSNQAKDARDYHRQRNFRPAMGLPGGGE